MEIEIKHICCSSSRLRYTAKWNTSK